MRIPQGLRPSTMDRALTCPASLYPEEGELLISVKGDDGGPADIGRAVHEMLHGMIAGEEISIPAICAKHGVLEKDVSYLRWATSQFANLLQEQFAGIEWVAEKKLSYNHFAGNLPLEGTPDLWGLSPDGQTLILADLKTGSSSVSYENQMRTYALLTLRSVSVDAKRVIALIFWARDLEIQKWEWTDEDIEIWNMTVSLRLLSWDGVHYTVGSHCVYCPRHVSCKARKEELASAQAVMVREPQGLVGADFAKAWNASCQIPKMIESWRDRVRETIQTTGAIDMGDGKKLDLIERNVAPDIDTVKAVRVLQEAGYTEAEIVNCCKLSKTQVLDVAGDRSPRGQKGIARKEIVEKLVEGGGIIPKTGMAFKVVEKEEE